MFPCLALIFGSQRDMNNYKLNQTLLLQSSATQTQDSKPQMGGKRNRSSLSILVRRRPLPYPGMCSKPSLLPVDQNAVPLTLKTASRAAAAELSEAQSLLALYQMNRHFTPFSFNLCLPYSLILAAVTNEPMGGRGGWGMNEEWGVSGRVPRQMCEA